MPQQVTMPRLDKDMEEGRIATWHRSEGDRVGKGDVLFEIETDKAAVEVEAEHEGTLQHVAVETGDSAPVEAVVAWIYAEGEEVGPPPESGSNGGDRQEEAATGDEPEPRSAPESVEPVSAERRERLLATPVARAEARARGMSLEEISGTGPASRVQKSDVLAKAAGTPSERVSDTLAAPESAAGEIAVLSSGAGDRLPMVMIHGFLADASVWDRLVPSLAQRRRVLRIELPCHGRSPIRRIKRFADLVQELRHVFDSIDAERCHLVGHSLGAAVALALADTRPQRIGSLTLIAPAGLGPEINGDAIGGMCRATRAASLGPWMKLLTSDPDAIGWSYVQAAAAARRDEALRASQMALAEALFPDGVQAFDLRAALDRLTAPTRIIWGRDDRIIPWRHALHAPGHASLNLFRGVGHMPQYEVPEQLMPLLDELG